MKLKSMALVVVFSAAAGLVHAQSGGMKAHKATGKVTKVDQAKSAVTIAHGPVASMNWPSMTMAFTVKDKALMDKLAKDKEIDFEFRQEGRDYVVTGVK